MTTQEQIERVQALLAKADPKNGASESERQSSLDMANKLKTKYGLTKEQIFVKKVEPSRPHPRPGSTTDGPRPRYYFDAPLSILSGIEFHRLVTTVSKRSDVIYSYPEHRFYSASHEVIREIASICILIEAYYTREESQRRAEKEMRFRQEMKLQTDREIKANNNTVFWGIAGGIFFGILLGIPIAL